MDDAAKAHSGHRKRLKARFLRHGLENFDDINALELLLFYAMPRRDTNLIAHALLERFGNLSGVLDAPAEELMSVAGVGESVAALLRLLPALQRRYLISKTPESEPVDTPARAGRYFLPQFWGEQEESVRCLFLDARHRVLDCLEIGRGTVNAADINARRIASLALEKKASAVILAHNHPSGIATPSAEDERSTQQLCQALGLVGVTLSDHIVVAGSHYTSMKECGLLR